MGLYDEDDGERLLLTLAELAELADDDGHEPSLEDALRHDLRGIL